MLTQAHLHAYLRHLADDLRRAASTVAGYRAELQLLLDRQVAMEPEVVAVFVTRTPEGALLAPTTRNRRLAIVRGFVRFLVATGALASDPTVSIRRARVPTRTTAALSVQDVARVAVAAGNEGSVALSVRDRAIVLLLFYTGLRVSELLRLDLRQVDLDAGLLRGATRKGGGATDVVIHPCASEALRTWLKQRDGGDGTAVFPRGNTVPSAAETGSATGDVFHRRNSGHLTVRAVQKRLAKLGQAAGLAVRLHPHLLRHAHATALLRVGVATEIIRQSLNHASIATTARYLHGDEALLRDAIGRLPWLHARMGA
ncbi:MAG: tyrosine-type recombinase/integrase [Patescibacteria group bacterium]